MTHPATEAQAATARRKSDLVAGLRESGLVDADGRFTPEGRATGSR